MKARAEFGMREIASIIEPEQHPRDISPADLQRGLERCSRPDLLQRLVEVSRASFGFYTSHFPYTINYPWVVERLEPMTRGSRILDVGAGVSPVPLLLADRGMLVDTVDNHKVKRTPPTQPDWNEWGYFDYSRVNAQVTAHHVDITEFAPPYRFDAAYSVSVFAHMRRDVRERAIERCYNLVKPEAIFLLAVDLIPATDFLWNRCEGVEVEPPICHGTVDDLLTSLASGGFRVVHSEVKRTVPKSRTDLLFIEAQRCPAGVDPLCAP